MTIQGGYGYGGYYKPPKTAKVNTGGGLAAAAAGGTTTASDPFGFQTSRNTTNYRDPLAASRPSAPAVQPPPGGSRQVTLPSSAQAQQHATPPVPGGYDLNTDVALQQANALTGLNDEQATAAALKQKQQLALGYGDQGFAKALGLDESFAQAAAGNPSSQLAQASQQRGRNEKVLTDQLFENNLGYGGYRITQEQQAAQDYENLLAGLAGQANTGADTISGNLATALAGNQQTRISAEQAARDRAIAAALATGGAGGTDGVPSMDGIPLTIQGPGPSAPPDNPIVAAHPYGTQTQTMSDVLAGGGASFPGQQPLYSGQLSPLAALLAPKPKRGYAGRALL